MNKLKSATSSFNSPIPSNLRDECKKAAKILNSFVDPGQGLDKAIPANILEKAQGLAILTVLKAGFLFSGRAGSGLVVASVVCTIRNWNGRRGFCHGLKHKRSLAAGPLGRNAEAAGTASLKHISAVYSYSKTKGLFAGVSLEGSVIVTRSDANEKFYGKKVSAKELLNGSVPPPTEADALYRALNAKFHTLGNLGAAYSRSSLDEDASSTGSSSVTRSQTFKSSNISAPGHLRQPPNPRGSGQFGSTPSSASGGGAPPPYQNTPPPTQPKPTGYNYQQQQQYHTPTPPSPMGYNNNGGGYKPPTPSAPAMRAPPPPPPSRKPNVPTARALYDFNGEQGGDLSFREGDVITIVEKSDSQDDWWTGTIGGRKGIFPANYVQLQ
ncbi:hypothetical protein BDA99DRAFT_597516 [Phascolomyces articulosus]|uniref:SH3 domain-containing protein n=1 Tax=Phascolomyces articulosus TaxID=60185 RepID=A0AAD5KI12_9FUNG|nr:hypothetical protein BDA99DRAFT_597516 [Phascolomyces articulosus]